MRKLIVTGALALSVLAGGVAVHTPKAQPPTGGSSWTKQAGSSWTHPSHANLQAHSKTWNFAR